MGVRKYDDMDEFEKTLQDNIQPVLRSVDDEATKNKIKDFWNDWVVPYFIRLESIDQAIRNGERDPAEAAIEVISATDSTLLVGDKLEESLNNPSLIKKIKDMFRLSGAPYGLQSDIVRHALEKPGGYPGDYELLECIYDNKATSKGFGHCADKTLLTNEYANAVRNRKDKMKKILLSYLQSDPKSSEILNVACGSSRDLRELFHENTIKLTGDVHFTLIDKSQEALDFSRDKLADCPEGIRFSFNRHSVYDYLKDPDTYRNKLGSMDMVYSIGLADYIPADGFRDLIAFFYTLLKPGGRLIIAHKDSKNYHPLTSDWWTDWSFHLRNIDDVVRLAENSGIADYDLTIEQEDDTNIIFFLIIQKR